MKCPHAVPDEESQINGLILFKFHFQLIEIKWAECHMVGLWYFYSKPRRRTFKMWQAKISYSVQMDYMNNLSFEKSNLVFETLLKFERVYDRYISYQLFRTDTDATAEALITEITLSGFLGCGTTC